MLALSGVISLFLTFITDALIDIGCDVLEVENEYDLTYIYYIGIIITVIGLKEVPF